MQHEEVGGSGGFEHPLTSPILVVLLSPPCGWDHHDGCVRPTGEIEETLHYRLIAHRPSHDDERSVFWADLLGGHLYREEK